MGKPSTIIPSDILRLAELPAFHDSKTWFWTKEGKHYEGNRVDPDGVWLIRRRNPHSRSPGTQRTLAEDFDFIAPDRFLLTIEAFVELNKEIPRMPDRRKRAEIIKTVRDEIDVVRRSFERANNHPFRIHLTDEVHSETDDYMYSLECNAAKLFFQFDQLRNCAKQDSRAYTVEQLQTIYSVLGRLFEQFVRNIESEFDLPVKGKLVGAPDS